MELKNRILKDTFGYDSFLKGQEKLISSILNGCDTLGIMPTGAGKSICFQIPALIFGGVSLIISPLISLMKDQVNSLTQVGIRSAFINSSLSDGQIAKALEHAKNGDYKLIYIAPERLMSQDFISFAQSAHISMVCVDEAHCISQWGQDFRPSYSKIPQFIDSLPQRPIISAFTATATPKVQEDIVRLLELQNPTVLITGFDRPNLYFEVQKPHDKFAAVLKYLKGKKDASGIIYCSTRATVEEVSARLNENGYSASAYHAGLSDIERSKNQEDFLYDRVKIMVATNAFGMGIDKSNVSFVIHFNMPKDVESYYQEAGRAGRDGENADCILLFSGQDVRTHLWLIENSKDREYQDLESGELLKARERRRLKEMSLYCSTTSCLRQYMLSYFGEAPPEHCENCSNCLKKFETLDITLESQKILSCVYRTKERFGGKMIIDILRGSKNAKILEMQFDKLATYNISQYSELRLRAIMDYLLENDYLLKTDEKFPVIKLGEKSKEVLFDKVSLTLQICGDDEIEAAPYQEKHSFGKAENILLSLLRELRLKLSAEQHVPAYVVFPDSTLIDMCMKMPTNPEAFLKVSGVGAVKLQKYGKLFMDVIESFADSKASENPQPREEGGEENPPKEEISLEAEISLEPISIKHIADKINCVRLQNSLPKITALKLNSLLLDLGYLEIRDTDYGRSFKAASEKGIAAGIKSENCIIRNSPCIVTYYNEAAQKMVIELAEKM